jgi:TolA-binding protein
MTKDDKVEELTQIFQTLIIQQKNLQAQLKDLNKSIANMNEQLTLLVELNKEPNCNTENIVTTNQSPVWRNNSFKIGDRVIVTNRYCGLQGTTGKIIKLSSAQATIEADNGDTFRKYKQNLHRI